MAEPHFLVAELDCTEDHEPGESHDSWCFDYAMTCPGVTSECEMWISCKVCTDQDRARLANDDDQLTIHGVAHRFFRDHGKHLVPGGVCYAVHGDHEGDLADYADGLPITAAGEYPVHMYPDGNGGMDLEHATTPQEDL